VELLPAGSRMSLTTRGGCLSFCFLSFWVVLSLPTMCLGSMYVSICDVSLLGVVVLYKAALFPFFSLLRAICMTGRVHDCPSVCCPCAPSRAPVSRGLGCVAHIAR